MKKIIPYTQNANISMLGIFWRKTISSTKYKLVLMALSFGLSAQLAFAQNCPTSGTHIQNSSENTYFPGTQANVAIGATSIT